MYSILAALFTTWSSASSAKFHVMNSMIGTEPDHRRADADAGEPELGDRRVDDAPLAELLEQALGDLVGALVDADFLAHEEDAVVPLHLFAQRLVERVSVGDDRHGTRVDARSGRPSAAGARRARRRSLVDQ